MRVQLCCFAMAVTNLWGKNTVAEETEWVANGRVMHGT